VAGEITHPRGIQFSPREDHPLTLPASCQQILTQDQPGTNDNHGCPYRHFSPGNLESALLAWYSPQDLTESDLGEVMKIVKEGHYHVACTRVFEITHAAQGVKKGDGVSGDCVTHPNQYVSKSRELEKAQVDGAKMDVDGSDAAVAS
jgi:DNA primase large subunit